MPANTESSLSGPYIPNGVTTDFAFDFKAVDASEVVALDQDGNLISTALYSVSLDDDEGGTLAFSVAPTLGDYTQIYVAGDPALTQPSDFDNAGPSFNPAALTRALDRAAARDLRQQRDIDRAFKVPFGEAGPTVPASATDALGVFAALASTDPGEGVDLVGRAAGFDAILRPSMSNAQIQAVLSDSSNVSIGIMSGSYAVNNLTCSTAVVRLIALGDVVFYKDANGDLLTLSGNDPEINGIRFYGDNPATMTPYSPAFTGHGVVCTGNRARIINCGSMNQAGRALKLAGSNNTVFGTNGGWYTADLTASGYEIEVGTSGTATFYTNLIGIVTAQSTGGILTTDTGNTQIIGGQFGKLTIAAGTSPSGVNGGHTVGARIIGAVTVGLSNALFTANMFAENVTISAGVSNCGLDSSNNFGAGKKVVNNGNLNNGVLEMDPDASGQIVINYGGKDKATSLKITPDASSGIFEFTQQMRLPYNKALQMRNSAGTGTVNVAVVYDANNSIQIGDASNASQNIAYSCGSGANHWFLVGGSILGEVDSAGIDTTGVYRVDNTQVVSNRMTGWAAPTGTATRTTFATSTVTTAQLAERVKALIDDLTTHGLIGS